MEISFKKALGIAAGLGFTGSAYADLTKFLSDRSESARIAGNVVALKALQVSQPDANTVTVIEVPDEAEAPAQESMAKGLAFDADRFENAVLAKVDAILKARGEVAGRPNVMPTVTDVESAEHRLYNDQIKAGKKKAFKDAATAEAFGAFMLTASNVLKNQRSRIGPDVADRVAGECSNVLKSFRPNIQKDYTTGAGSLDVLTGTTFAPDLIRLFDTFGVAGSYCNVINTSEQSYIRTRNLTETANVTYPSEGATAVQSDAVFTSETMRVRQAMATSAISLSAIRFSRVNMAESIATDFARWFAYQEDQNVFFGDGTLTYGRMLGLGAQFMSLGTAGLTPSTAYGSVVASGAGTLWGKFTLADFQKALGRIPQYVWATGSPAWYCTRQFAEEVMKPLARAAGGNTAGDIAGFKFDNFLGLPINVVEVMSHTSEATGTTVPSKIPCYVGDLAMGVDLLRNTDLQIDSDASVQFDKGNIVFRGLLNHDVSAIHAVGSTVKAGPVVMLYTV